MTSNNPSLWHLLVVLTIVVGVAVTVLTLDREKYFPSLYAHAGDDTHADSAAHHEADTHIEAALPEASTEVVKPEETKKEEPVRRPEPGNYVLVAGSFLSEEYARLYQSSLQQKVPDIEPEIVQITLDSSTYYRVVALRGVSKTDVISVKRSLEEAGYTPTWFFRK